MLWQYALAFATGLVSGGWAVYKIMCSSEFMKRVLETHTAFVIKEYEQCCRRATADDVRV